MKKLVKVVSGLAIVAGAISIGAQVVSASTEIARLAPAEDVATNPAIKKGQNVVVIVKNTKKQTVATYNDNGQKLNKNVKMGSEFTAKAVKKTNGKKLVKVAANEWVKATDVTQN